MYLHEATDILRDAEIVRFTEAEAAHFLARRGVNALPTKHEKLAFANTHLASILTALWTVKEKDGPFYRDKIAAEKLARRLESLEGLGAVVTLAGVGNVIL